LWAVFESGIVEIAKYLQGRQSQRLSIDDLRASNDFERALKYYADVLRFPLIEIDGAQERLNRLLLARKIIAHSNGRVEAIKPALLQKLHQLEKELGVVLVGTYHVSFPIGLVQEAALTVKNVLDDLIRRVKEKHE
jgi:GTP1/Obg family GTP-binding protein